MYRGDDGDVFSLQSIRHSVPGIFLFPVVFLNIYCHANCLSYYLYHMLHVLTRRPSPLDIIVAYKA